MRNKTNVQDLKLTLIISINEIKTLILSLMSPVDKSFRVLMLLKLLKSDQRNHRILKGDLIQLKTCGDVKRLESP